MTTTGTRVTVSWLDSRAVPAQRRGIESRIAGDAPILVVRSSMGTAVVGGGAQQAALWSAAAVLESGTA